MLNKEEFLKEIKYNFSKLTTEEEKLLLEDREFLFEVLKINPSVIRFVEQLQNDKEVIREVVKQSKKMESGIGLLEFASEEIRADEDFMLEMLSIDNWALESASDELRENKKFVLTAMRGRHSIPLWLASERLQRDKDVVLENIANDILRKMQYDISKIKCETINGEIKVSLPKQDLGIDEEQKREIIKKNIESILLKTYDDEDILKVVKELEKYENLEDILKKIKGDFTNPFKEKMIKKIEEKPSLLEYADYEIRNDKEVILSMIKKAWYVFRFASKELRADKEVILAAIEENALNLQYASEELKDDEEIVIKAVKQIGAAIGYASERLKNDREIGMEAIKNDHLALCLAGEKLKNDKNFVIEAMKHNPDTLFGASKELQLDKDVVLEYTANKILKIMQNDLKCNIESKEEKRKVIKENIESILLKKFNDEKILKAVNILEEHKNLQEILNIIKK